MRVTPNYFIIMFVEFSHMEKKDFPRVILSNILEAFHLQGLCLMLGISALLITRPGRCAPPALTGHTFRAEMSSLSADNNTYQTLPTMFVNLPGWSGTLSFS